MKVKKLLRNFSNIFCVQIYDGAERSLTSFNDKTEAINKFGNDHVDSWTIAYNGVLIHVNSDLYTKPEENRIC